MAELKTALEGDDAEVIKEKTSALAQSSMKLGEAMYQASQDEENGDQEDAGDDNADDVVDADFEEVKDDEDDKKSS